MKRKARIAGTVTYLNEKGQRFAIPLQHCAIDDGPGFGPTVTVFWKDEKGIEHETKLTEKEFAHYVSIKALKVPD